MARVRSGGSTGALVALILFVVLTVVSALLAIIFYTRIEQAELDAQARQEQVQELATRGELNGQALQQIKVAADQDNQSVFGEMNERNKKLTRFIIGRSDAELAEVEAELQTLGLDLNQGGNLIEAVRTARANWDSESRKAQQLTQQLQEAGSQLQQVTREKGSVAQTFNTSTQGLKQQLQQQNNQFQAYEQQVQQKLQGLDQQIEQMQQKHQQRLAELRSQNEQLETEKTRLQQRIAELTRTTGAGGPAVDTSLIPKGKIVSVLPQENLVYINRGQEDRVILGMTFEVFDRREGIYYDEFRELRGKATIQVISSTDSTSVCRVVRRERGAALSVDDLLANAVYDPDKVYSFYVFGLFDLDNTGELNAPDRRRIEALVRQWGGEVSDDMSYDVDFLVLGPEPDLPEEPEADAGPVAREEYLRKKRLFEQYHSLVGEAKALGIPVLNQNRFLALVGYYER